MKKQRLLNEVISHGGPMCLSCCPRCRGKSTVLWVPEQAICKELAVSKHLRRCERMTPQNASRIAIGHPCKLQLLLVQTETATIPVSKVFACAKQTWKPNTFIVVSNCPNLNFQYLHLLNLFFWQVRKCMVYTYIYRHVHMCGGICVRRRVCMWVGMHVKARDLLSSSSSSFHLKY